MLQKIQKNKIQCTVILLIVVIQFAFVFQKEGYHMDELISFEMANAEYNPWIVPIQPVGRLAKFMQEEIEADTFGEKVQNIVDTVKDVLENRSASKMLSYKADVYEEPVWITREQFHNYLTTGGSDSFNYLSVYFNVKDDNHPPVHFMLLHTVSSIFRGEIWPVMGCLINIVTLIGCAVLMMKLGELLDEQGITINGLGRRVGILTAFLYGCSQAAIATTLLIRMYAVLTFFCVLTFYIHIKKWLTGSFEKKNFGIILVTAAGFWTQYFFLFYCLVLSVVMVVCLWIAKRKKETFIYIRSMIIAGVLGVGLYPFAISDVFSSTRGVEAIANLQGGFADYGERLVRFGEILLYRCFGHWSIGLVLLIAILVLCVICTKRYTQHRLLLALYVFPVIGYFFLAAKMSPMYVDRYFMAAFPFVISWLAFLVCVMLRKKSKNIQLVGGLLILLYCGFHVITYGGTYLYKGYEEQAEIAKENRAQVCICLYEGSGYYENLLEFAEYEKTLLVTPSQMINRKNAAELMDLEEAVFVVKSIVPEEKVQEIFEQYGFVNNDVLVEKGAHGDRVYFCRK